MTSNPWSNPRMPYAMSTERRRLAPPDGRPIIVNIAINIERWPFDQPMPRGILPPPHGKPADPPDVPNFAWVEYGMRAGMPRIMRMLAERGIKASALMNTGVEETYPSLMDALLKAEWEMVGHGWIQRSLKNEADERAVVERCLGRLREISGQPVRAWLGPGLGETAETPEVLRENGIEFLHDWYVDDLPVWMRTRAGPMLAMPYAFELNDVPMYVIQHAPSRDWLERVEATLAVYEEETKAGLGPRVMTLSLHPHVIGVPHVAHWFQRTLDLLTARDDVIFMTSSEIGDWFVAADGTGGAEVDAFREAAPPGSGG